MHQIIVIVNRVFYCYTLQCSVDSLFYRNYSTFILESMHLLKAARYLMILIFMALVNLFPVSRSQYGSNHHHKLHHQHFNDAQKDFLLAGMVAKMLQRQDNHHHCGHCHHKVPVSEPHYGHERGNHIPHHMPPQMFHQMPFAPHFG